MCLYVGKDITVGMISAPLFGRSSCYCTVAIEIILLVIMIGTHHNSQIIEVECIIAQIMVEVRDVFNDAIRHH